MAQLLLFIEANAKRSIRGWIIVEAFFVDHQGEMS